MSRYIDAEKLKDKTTKVNHIWNGTTNAEGKGLDEIIDDIPTADVVEADKAQKEIDYWHDKAQSYEQTILKLSLNKADVVEVVRCKDCKHRHDSLLNGSPFEDFCDVFPAYIGKDDYCSYGERADA